MHIPILAAIIIALVVAVVVLLIIFRRKRTALRRARLEHDNENEQLQQPQEKEAKRVEERLPAVEAKVRREVEAEHEAGKPLQIPEDSTLRRHFLTQLRVDAEAELPLRPTDPTLRRHYDHMVVAEMEERVGGPLPEAPAAESVPTAPAVPLRVIEPTAGREVKAGEAVKAKPVAAGPLQVPEDSTLRRHFLAQLRTEIEAQMPAAPTDASLRRHYDATVDAELGQRLAGGKA